jgi:transposase InsO family protein
MIENRWRRRLVPGVSVVLDGVPHLIDDVLGESVRLVAPDGKPRHLVPVRHVAQLLSGTDSPPPLSERVFDVESRLSPAGKVKLDERRAILRWFETGLKPEQGGSEAPDPRHDPARVPDRRARVLAIAAVLAERRGIKLASARTHVNRILEKASTGAAGLADPRMIQPSKRGQYEMMETWIREFLLDRTFQSTVTSMSIHVAFSAWLRREHQHEAPPLRSFERDLKVVYGRYPHLRRKTKSLASTAQAPKVTLQRRFAMRPGEYWFIDTTTSNVMLRDPYAPASKARQYRLSFTKVMDGATRYIVGRSISENVNGFAAGLALADAFRAMLDERDAVVMNGRSYPRPFVGLPHAISSWPIPPRRLVLDNGREFLNKYGMLTLERLGIDVEPQRVRDGRAKGALERHFGTYKTNFEQTQHNYLGGSIDERGRDATANVILTWHELLARDTEWTDSYNVTEHGGLRAETGRRISPAQYWMELAQEHGTTEMVAWRNEWIRFLPNQVVDLTPYGVARKDMVFNAPIIRFLIEVDGAAPSGKVRIFWDPVDLRQVYCFDPEGNAYELPWVRRDEDTPPITDFMLDWANGQVHGMTYSKSDHQSRLIDLVARWQSEDVVLLAQLRERKNGEEIFASQLNVLRSHDSGLLVPADAAAGQDTINSMHHEGEDLIFDEDGTAILEDGYDLDDDLFGGFA